jgi:hypothetical protein
MKKNLFVIMLITVLAAFISLTGCKQKTQTADSNDIRFDSVSVTRIYHLMGKTDNPHCDLRIQYVYPVGGLAADKLKAVQDVFIRALFGDDNSDTTTIAGAVNHYADQYVDDYKSLETDFAQEMNHDHEAEESSISWYSYYEDISNEIYFNSYDILCFGIVFENYTGGAHGSHSYSAFNINLATGTQITESDIFIDGYGDELAKLLVRKLAVQNNAKEPKDLEDMGYFSIDEIYPNGNFTIDAKGITYYFNEYEIAAYVVGQSSISLTFEELTPLLKENSPLTPLIAGNNG